MSTPAKTPVSQAYRFAAPRAKSFGVDRNLGILTGVALITAGVEAIGHGIWIDDKTVSTTADVLAKKANRFKAAISHLSWGDYWDGETDRVMEFPGWFDGASAKPGPTGLMLVADKLEFYDDFKSDQKRLFNRILEMAEKTPDLFGISLEPYGYLVYVGEDGVEYSERPKDLPLKYDGRPALRVTDLTYGAIVDDPAANPGGFFAKLSRKFPKSEVLNFIRGLMEQEAAAAEFAGKQSAGPVGNPGPLGVDGAPKPGAAALVNSAAPVEPQPVPSPASAMKEILNSIKAAFGADKAKFAQAMSIFGEKPEITFEALKAEMVSLDLAAATQQVTTLTTANAKLKTDLDAADAKAKDWEKKFTDLKTSGVGAEINLGATSAGAAQDNPWIAPVNLTRQAEITNSNPALAKQLEEAAKHPAAKKA